MIHLVTRLHSAESTLCQEINGLSTKVLEGNGQVPRQISERLKTIAPVRRVVSEVRRLLANPLTAKDVWESSHLESIRDLEGEIAFQLDWEFSVYSRPFPEFQLHGCYQLVEVTGKSTATIVVADTDALPFHGVLDAVDPSGEHRAVQYSVQDITYPEGGGDWIVTYDVELSVY